MGEDTKSSLLEVPYGFRRSQGVEGEMARQLLKACGLPVVSARTGLREMAVATLGGFVRHLWKWVDPHSFIEGWHIDCMCEHLEAVSRGEIRKLLITLPPRHAKSICVSVMWPLWDWLALNAARQFFCVSYSDRLSLDLSMKCRTLLKSAEYRLLLSIYRKGMRLSDEMDTKGRFDNSAGGYRLATTVEGAAFGLGGDIAVIDDPHNTQASESDAARESVLRWFDGPLQTRLNNPNAGGIVVVMQRRHEEDLAGHILESAAGKNWTYLCLPARYEGEHRSRSGIAVRDPRIETGTALWPQMWNTDRLAELEEGMSAFDIASQLQQHPAPRTGGFFPMDKFRKVTTAPPGKVIARVRYVDKAATEGGGARTAMSLVWLIDSGLQLLGGRPRYWLFVADVVRGQWAPDKREQQIRATALADGKAVTIWVEQEPGSGGKDSVISTISNLMGYNVKADKVTGDKETRAQPYADQVGAENVFVLDGQPWTKDFLHEHAMFPHGKLKDIVDATAGAVGKLIAFRPRGGCWATDVRNLAQQGAGRV